MEDLANVPWPPTPITTERLVLRGSEARDRPVFLDLYSLPEVNAYLGGGSPREEIDARMPEIPAAGAGSFVVERDGTMIGHVMIRRTPADARPTAAGKADLGYLFLPESWGSGYAAEACAAALAWFDGALPGEPVVLTTQSANVPSMRLAERLGFTEVERFEAWGAEQWFAMRPARA